MTTDNEDEPRWGTAEDWADLEAIAGEHGDFLALRPVGEARPPEFFEPVFVIGGCYEDGSMTLVFQDPNGTELFRVVGRADDLREFVAEDRSVDDEG